MQSSNSPSCQCDYPEVELASLTKIAEDAGLSLGAIQSFSGRVSSIKCFYVFALGHEAEMYVKAAQDAYDYLLSNQIEPEKDQQAEQRPTILLVVDDNDAKAIEIAQRFCREYNGSAKTFLCWRETDDGAENHAKADRVPLNEDQCQCDGLLMFGPSDDDVYDQIASIFMSFWGMVVFDDE